SVGVDFAPGLVEEAPQMAVGAAPDRARPHLLHFLRDHADIGPVAAVVGEAIEAKAVVEPADEHDVVLERNVGAPAAATAAETSATAAAAEATATTEAAAPAHARPSTAA